MITGATSGIGKATATMFAKKGYNIIITGRRKSRLHELKIKLTTKYAVKIKSLSFDVTQKDQCKNPLKAWNILGKKLISL